MIRQVFEKSPFQPNHLISGWNMTKNNHPQKGCPVENPNRWPRRCCFPNNPGAKFVRQQPKAGHLWSGQTSSEGSDLQKGYLGILEGFLRFFFWSRLFQVQKIWVWKSFALSTNDFPNISSKWQWPLNSFPPNISKHIHQGDQCFYVSFRDWKHTGILPKRTGESHSNINLGRILTPKSSFRNDSDVESGHFSEHKMKHQFTSESISHFILPCLIGFRWRTSKCTPKNLKK